MSLWKRGVEQERCPHAGYKKPWRCRDTKDTMVHNKHDPDICGSDRSASLSLNECFWFENIWKCSLVLKFNFWNVTTAFGLWRQQDAFWGNYNMMMMMSYCCIFFIYYWYKCEDMVDSKCKTQCTVGSRLNKQTALKLRKFWEIIWTVRFNAGVVGGACGQLTLDCFHHHGLCLHIGFTSFKIHQEWARVASVAV